MLCRNIDNIRPFVSVPATGKKVSIAVLPLNKLLGISVFVALVRGPCVFVIL